MLFVSLISSPLVKAVFNSSSEETSVTVLNRWRSKIKSNIKFTPLPRAILWGGGYYRIQKNFSVHRDRLLQVCVKNGWSRAVARISAGTSAVKNCGSHECDSDISITTNEIVEQIIKIFLILNCQNKLCKCFRLYEKLNLINLLIRTSNV